MSTETVATESTVVEKRGGCRLFAIVFAAVLLALLLAALLFKLWLFPSALKPVQLRESEKIELNQKLRALGLQENAFDVAADKDEIGADGVLKPRKYSEEGASRELRFSERELNALLAKNTDLASKLAIDLSNDLASARLVLPLDPDFPFLGGQTLRMSAGVEVKYDNARPSITLRGVSAWGVPLPNAWLGNLKHVDVISEFGQEAGFWKNFADGVEKIAVRDGELYIQLKP